MGRKRANDTGVTPPPVSRQEARRYFSSLIDSIAGNASLMKELREAAAPQLGWMDRMKLSLASDEQVAQAINERVEPLLESTYGGQPAISARQFCHVLERFTKQAEDKVQAPLPRIRDEVKAALAQQKLTDCVTFDTQFADRHEEPPVAAREGKKTKSDRKR